MIDIFKRLAPSYSAIVKKLGIDVWYDKANLDDFMTKAEKFKKRYERELAEHYRKNRIPFKMSEIKDLADEWLADQITLFGEVEDISKKKKNDLQVDLNKVKDKKKEEVSELIEDAKRHEGKVSRVVSFSTNLEKKSEQLGEQQAFDLATKINHSVVEGISEVYEWMTQEDSRVRKTHRKLAGKFFTYDNPPTTIDKYGHTHTGHPGTDWGCRCWEEPAIGKPLRNYIAKA